jgi:hypothetical protein
MTVSTSSSEGISTYSSRAERYAAGKALRAKAPRTSHAEWASAFIYLKVKIWFSR